MTCILFPQCALQTWKVSRIAWILFYYSFLVVILIEEKCVIFILLPPPLHLLSVLVTAVRLRWTNKFKTNDEFKSVLLCWPNTGLCLLFLCLSPSDAYHGLHLADLYLLKANTDPVWIYQLALQLFRAMLPYHLKLEHLAGLESFRRTNETHWNLAQQNFIWFSISHQNAYSLKLVLLSYSDLFLLRIASAWMMLMFHFTIEGTQPLITLQCSIETFKFITYSLAYCTIESSSWR